MHLKTVQVPLEVIHQLQLCLFLTSDHVLNHCSSKDELNFRHMSSLFFFSERLRLEHKFSSVPPPREMNICAIDGMLLTEREDGIAKHLEILNVSIKQYVAFQGSQFICISFFFSPVLYPLRK